VKKEAFFNSLLFGFGKRIWYPRIFVKITKLSLQQVGKTSWQIGIHVMPSDGGLAYLPSEGEILSSSQNCQVVLSTCWRLFFVVLAKILGCQVLLANSWSWSKVIYGL